MAALRRQHLITRAVNFSTSAAAMPVSRNPIELLICVLSADILVPQGFPARDQRDVVTIVTIEDPDRLLVLLFLPTALRR